MQLLHKHINLALLLFAYQVVTAQQADPAMIYSMHTRLGMNGHIRYVTTYKYTNLKHTEAGAEHAKGTLYSVIKNWYDTAGYITRDSTAIFYNPRSAYGYCKDYTYSQQNGTSVILINTRFDCMPPYDNKAVVPTIVELTVPNDSTILAREYEGTELEKRRKNIVSSYRFTVAGGLIRTTVFDAHKKGRRHNGISTYKYDEYDNFTQTILKLGELQQQVIDHKISTIDDQGNAIRMLNFVNNSPEPDFMTVYEFEYYE